MRERSEKQMQGPRRQNGRHQLTVSRTSHLFCIGGDIFINKLANCVKASFEPRMQE